jgi:ubiquinone/menaquinone biosynthesis C-methylase UbiE
MGSLLDSKHNIRKHLVKIAVASGLLASEDTPLRNLGVVKIAARLGLLQRWTFNCQCTAEARQLGYSRAKKLFGEKRKYHKALLKERNPQKRALLALEHYNNIYSDLKNTTPVDSDEGKNTFGFKSDYIESAKDLFANRTVIDIGCGAGVSTAHIGRYAKTVYGLECSTFILEEARKRCESLSNIHFLFIEGTKLPFDDRSIEVAYSNDVIEHFHPDDAIMHLQEVLRVLKERGRYYFWTPGKNTGPHDFTKNFYPKGIGVSPMASHIREYNFAEMIAILKQVGYRKVILPDIKKEVLLIAEK